MEMVFVGRKIIANQKLVYSMECRTVMFCFHCEQPFLTTTEEMPEDFRCPRCGCPHFQTLFQKIQEEKDLDVFRERAKDLTENEARKIAELEAIRHTP
ncbi:MAG: hypothetical protein DRN81_03975 [Thermoproteota archaeon]|nr:MAG: hypothetical protein DRN81_03975 [Candidatus Korarchaeota archaeon]